MLIDLQGTELDEYRSSQTDPRDFDEFWSASIASARATGGTVVLTPVDAGLVAIDVFDVTFPGWNGEPIRAWLRVPSARVRDSDEPLPTVIEYVGYGGGRGAAHDNLLLAASGFAHFQMDSRGQGASWSRGDTPDSGSTGPQVPGVMTRGIGSRETYYYRRLIVDAVRAVDAVRGLDRLNPERVAVIGTSQGGGIALAVAGLVPDVAALSATVPFLCDFPRGITVTDAYPFHEIVDYLAIHRDQVARVNEVLSYFDGVNFARRAIAPARFSAALMDPIVPPSTVYAALAAYGGTSELTTWPFNAHEAGGTDEDLEIVGFVRKQLAAQTADQLLSAGRK